MTSTAVFTRLSPSSSLAPLSLSALPHDDILQLSHADLPSFYSRPLFIEEPLLPGHVEEMKKLYAQTTIPIAVSSPDRLHLQTR